MPSSKKKKRPPSSNSKKGKKTIREEVAENENENDISSPPPPPLSVSGRRSGSQQKRWKYIVNSTSPYQLKTEISLTWTHEQGLCDVQEDRFVVKMFRSEASDSKEYPDENWLVILVCDGHRGSVVSEFVTQHWCHLLKQTLVGNTSILRALLDTCALIRNNWGFVCTQTDSADEKRFSGSTVTCAVIRAATGEMYACNLGDSRLILTGDEGNIHVMTRVHTPEDSLEAARLELQNGRAKCFQYVDATDPNRTLTEEDATCQYGRIGGVLTASRGIGFHFLRDCMITDMDIYKSHAFPLVRADVGHVPISHDVSFLVVATNGFWEVSQPNKVSRWLWENRQTAPSAQDLFRQARKGTFRAGDVDHSQAEGSEDDLLSENCTIIVCTMKSLTSTSSARGGGGTLLFQQR